MTTLPHALVAWGDYDRDKPFPLFEQLRELAAVHAVGLADGHDAWLIVRHTEARAALADPRLSKDMRAALAANHEVVAEGLPGPALNAFEHRAVHRLPGRGRHARTLRAGTWLRPRDHGQLRTSGERVYALITVRPGTSA